MAAIITAGGTNSSGTHIATGVTEVIASGSFEAATVQLYLANNGQPPAPIAALSGPGAVSVSCANGAAITAKVVGGQSPSVSVTCNP